MTFSIKQCDDILTAEGAILEMETVCLHGASYRVWKRCPTTFQSFFRDAFDKYSSRCFVVDARRNTSFTFKQIYDRASDLAAEFQHHGARVGTRIAIGGENSPEWVICFIAIHLIGAVAVCLNNWMSSDELHRCIQLTHPFLIYGDDDLILRLQGSPCSVHSWHGSSEQQRVPQPVQGLHSESDAVIFFSSGTSGPSKAVLSTHRMALTNLWSGLVAPSRIAIRAGNPIPPLPRAEDRQKVVLLSVPLFHVTGCLSWLMRAILAGSKMIMIGRWSTEAALHAIVKEKVNAIGGVPSIVEAILRSASMKTSAIDTIFYGGAPPRLDLAGEVRKRWPNASLVQGYGMTETNAYVCSIAGTDYMTRPSSCGPPVPVCDVRIVDPSTRQNLGPGRSGLLLVRGPQIMKEYVGDPVATTDAIDAEGWLNTGDLAMIDSEGFVHIRDRLKDIIIRGGENIPSTEVENVICRLPGVLEAAVVGLPDPILGEQIGVMIFGRELNSEAELLALARNRLPRRAVPALLSISHAPLPRNAAGKYLKREIRSALLPQWELRGKKIMNIQSKL